VWWGCKQNGSGLEQAIMEGLLRFKENLRANSNRKFKRKHIKNYKLFRRDL